MWGSNQAAQHPNTTHQSPASASRCRGMEKFNISNHRMTQMLTTLKFGSKVKKGLDFYQRRLLYGLVQDHHASPVRGSIAHRNLEVGSPDKKYMYKQVD